MRHLVTRLWRILNQSQATTYLSATEAIDRLEALYDSALAALRDAISAFIRDGSLPDVGERAKGLFSYPQLSVSWDGRFRDHQRTRAYGVSRVRVNTAPLLRAQRCSANT